MNLWGHRFSQNTNQKLQRFLPYPLINSQGRNLCNFWLIFWEKRWPHKFILNLTDLYILQFWINSWSHLLSRGIWVRIPTTKKRPIMIFLVVFQVFRSEILSKNQTASDFFKNSGQKSKWFHLMQLNIVLELSKNLQGIFFFISVTKSCVFIIS